MALSYDERACSRRAGGSWSRCSPSRRASPPRCRRSASSFPCLAAGPLAAWLIGRFGWRAAYVALGALIAAVGVPASLCVSYPESAEARHVTAGAGARWPAADRRLWYFVGAWGFLGFVYMMVTVHSVAYARDRGLPLEQASLALTAFGVGAIVGRLVAGAAADHFGVRTTMRVCLVIQA